MNERLLNIAVDSVLVGLLGKVFGRGKASYLLWVGLAHYGST